MDAWSLVVETYRDLKRQLHIESTHKLERLLSSCTESEIEELQLRFREQVGCIDDRPSELPTKAMLDSAFERSIRH
ncbi:MAG: hypothetical protein KUG79_08580 [Pseudomonadales bacterium]|nr:hypothetical protein [Pseudomonadales bacterium]